jgi:hypothetical protein
MIKNAIILFLVIFFSSNFCLSQEFIKGDGGCGLEMKPRGGGVDVKALSAHSKEEEAKYFSQGGLSTSNPTPETTDPTTLFVDISDDDSTLYLNWNGDDSPFVISRSSDPSFQQDVEVIEKEAEATSIEISPKQDKLLECFDVSGKSVVSYPAQGIGYDPDPLPSVPQVNANTFWWGDTLTINSNYLDPIAKANLMPMGDRCQKAKSVTTIGSYGVSADFEIADDSRGFYTLVQSNGRLSDPTQNYPFIYLSPRGYEYVSGVKCISYAPQTGKVWISGSGTLFELDLFRRDVENGKGVEITSFSNPLISRVSNDGRLVVVDGVNGAECVYQVDVTTGAMTVYASTKDDSFTRSIYPKGIGFAPDGSACYIADGNNHKVVKIPANAGSGSSTIKDNWGNRTFNFSAMPIGIDVNIAPYYYVVVSSGDGNIYQITGQLSSYLLAYIGSVANSIEIDRDYSISNYTYFYYESGYVFANCYNKNQVEGNVPSFHGGALFGDISSGFIDLEPHWFFVPYRNFPQKVLLNSANVSYPYPSPYQVSDRIVELKIRGWQYRPVKLKVIDPPDFSPYAPDGGWGGSSQHLPYEGNDNVGMSDYGICLTADCSGGAQTERVVTIGSDWTANVYLKVPARYSGNNFQVLIEKTDYYGNPLPETKIAASSPLFTTWKRVYVERDKMFRRGGLLYEDFNKSACGSDCNQIRLYDWANVHKDDVIVVFDELSPYETKGEVKTVSTEPVNNGDGTITVTLDSNLTANCYYASTFTGDPPMPDFANGHSGGAGVLLSADFEINDTSSNQINGPGSAFYDADMRAIEQTYNDAYVQFLGLRDGMSAVPYLPKSWFDWAYNYPQQEEGVPLALFSQIWFKHFAAGGGSPPLDTPHNYFHLISASDVSNAYGLSVSCYDYSYIFSGKILSMTGTEEENQNRVRFVTNHETGHQFDVNTCPNSVGGHDTPTRMAWCSMENSCGTGCEECPAVCIMAPLSLDLSEDAKHGVNRFCIEDLFSGDPNCDERPGGIRKEVDPK